jgi:vitamin B12 transporter
MTFGLGAHAQAQQRAEEMVVTGTLLPVPKREVGTAISVIDSEEIVLRGYEGLADLLRTQPGIGVTNTGGPGKATALRIRGEEGYRTQLIIDGVKAVDPSGAHVSADFDSLLATDDLERIEVLRGPQGFIYGADAGGVVNVMTRRGSGPLGGRMSAETGSFDTRRVNASLSGGNERGDYYVSFNDFTTAGINSQTSDTALRDRDGASNKTWHTKLGLDLSDDWRLQLVAHDVDAQTQYDGCFHPATFAIVYDCVGTTSQATYKVSAQYSGEKFTHAFGYSDLDIRHDNLADGAGAFGSHGELGRVEYTGSYRPTKGQTLIYGLDLQNERVVAEQSQQRDQNAAYFEYEGELADGVFLTAGTRHDNNDDFGAHTSSRVSLAVARRLRGGNAVKYRASYGTGFRAPSLYEIAYNRGPSAYAPAAGLALSPEQSKGFDLGFELDAMTGLHFEITVFDQNIDDEVYFDLATFSGYLQSPGESTSRGIELGLAVPIGKRLQFLANVTSNDTADTTNAQRLRRPKLFGNLGLRYDAADALRVIVNARFARDAVDIDPVTFVDHVPLPDYAVVDASVSYALSKALELYGRVENAFDENYIEALGFNTAGRAAYLGIRVHF